MAIPDSSVPIAPEMGYERAFVRWVNEAAEHPQHQALLRAAAEQVVAPPYEESEPFKQKCGEIRALLADVPAVTRKAYQQARAHLAEVEAALQAAETERGRIGVARTLERRDLDRWATDAAVVDQRMQALTQAHTQATEDVQRATQALLTAMVEAAERRRVALAADVDTARSAVREAQAALRAAHEAERAASALYRRLRDDGLDDRHVAFVFQGEALCNSK